MLRFGPLALSLLRMLKALFRRLMNSINQVWRIRREPVVRVWAVLAVAIGVLFFSIWSVAPGIVPSLSINLLAGAIGGIVGVYFSLEVIRPYIRTVERQRIDRAEQIIDSYQQIYEDDMTAYPDFIQLDTINAWIDRPRNRYVKRFISLLPGPFQDFFILGIRLRSEDEEEECEEAPITTVYEPSEIHSLDDFSCVPAKTDAEAETGSDGGQLYTVPERLESLLEPYEDDIRRMFRQENRKNEEKMRLDEYRDGTFVYSRTTYYRSFLTNFCPDYPARSKATIRTLTAPLLFDETGSAIPLSESAFSNHFGGGGLVVTTGGEALIAVRGKTVAVEGNSKHLSFSGSFNYEAITDDGLEVQIKSILEEETSIDRSNVVETCMLGVTRRVERLGKPDLVTLVLVDEDASWEAATHQFISMDAVPVTREDVRFNSITDLFKDDRAYTITRSLVEHLDERAYPPSIGLVSAIYLMDALADSVNS